MAFETLTEEIPEGFRAVGRAGERDVELVSPVQADPDQQGTAEIQPLESRRGDVVGGDTALSCGEVPKLRLMVTVGVANDGVRVLGERIGDRLPVQLEGDDLLNDGAGGQVRCRDGDLRQRQVEDHGVGIRLLVKDAQLAGEDHPDRSRPTEAAVTDSSAVRPDPESTSGVDGQTNTG